MPQKPKPPSQVTFEEFWRRAVFGIICGTVTGFTVGAVDAYKLFKGGTVKQPDLPRVAFHEMGRSAVIVAVFWDIPPSRPGHFAARLSRGESRDRDDDWCGTIIDHARFTKVRALRPYVGGRGHVPLVLGAGRGRAVVVSVVCSNLSVKSFMVGDFCGCRLYCYGARTSGLTDVVGRDPSMLQAASSR